MKLPKNYRGNGRHLFCNKDGCSKVISADKSRCNHKDVLSRNCPFADKHIFQSRIWNPITGKTDKVKSWPDIADPQEFEIAHANYKKELQANDYGVIQKVKPTSKPVLLHELINMYLDFLEDIGVPEHEKENRSKSYIQDEKRYLKTFLRVIAKKYNPSQILISGVGSSMVEMLYNYLNTKDYKARTWNAHFNAGTKFFNWLSRQGYELNNPFKKVTKRSEATDPQPIEESEFELQLSLIKPENGIELVGIKRIEKKQRYKKWLKNWLLLSVFTGGRPQDISLMKCDHVKNNYIVIPNHKVNAKENTNINKSYAPMIAELHILCDKLGVYDRNPEEYIIEPHRVNRKSLADEASAGFRQFWRQTGIQKEGISLYNLRSTYITRMGILKGDKGVGIHHKKIDTAYKHYFGKKDANKDLVDQKIFGFDVLNLTD
ncbi:MAG: hypothetical protein ACJA2S_003888 [Cyclobacteriaceae bacterium]|jgi:hypothetical protein